MCNQLATQLSSLTGVQTPVDEFYSILERNWNNYANKNGWFSYNHQNFGYEFHMFVTEMRNELVNFKYKDGRIIKSGLRFKDGVIIPAYYSYDQTRNLSHKVPNWEMDVNLKLSSMQIGETVDAISVTFGEENVEVYCKVTDNFFKLVRVYDSNSNVKARNPKRPPRGFMYRAFHELGLEMNAENYKFYCEALERLKKEYNLKININHEFSYWETNKNYEFVEGYNGGFDWESYLQSQSESEY